MAKQRIKSRRCGAPSKIMIRLLCLAFALLAVALVGSCKKKGQLSPKECENATNDVSCQSCCQAAGRTGGTWVDDDCMCYK